MNFLCFKFLAVGPSQQSHHTLPGIIPGTTAGRGNVVSGPTVYYVACYR